MRKILILLCALLVSAPMLTGCNKLSGDNSLLALLGLNGNSDTFMKQFGTTTTASLLVFESDRDGKNQYLYTASEVGAGGKITKIRLMNQSGTLDPSACRNTTIKMGHVNLAGLTTTYANNAETGQGSLVTVLDNKTVKISAGAAESWFEIPLDTPFSYNGVDNLVVELTRNTACSVPITVTVFEAGTARRAWSRGDVPDVAGAADHNTVTATAADQYQPWMQFVFEGGDNLVSHAGASNWYPLTTNIDYQRAEMLYLADLINGSGEITGVGFIVGSTTDGADYTVTVRLGHTSLDELGAASWDANFNADSPVTVAENAVFRVPAGVPAGATLWLPLTASFYYNGTDNLLVDINVTAASDVTSLQLNSSGTNTRALGSGTVLGSVDNAQYSVKLRFKGGSADVITAGTDQINMPFTPVFDSQVQFVYRAAELGVQGDISRVGFRMYGDSTADTYHNFHVVMGHTDKTALSTLDTFASNLDDATTVYDGAVLIPAGLKGGDWFSIPLSHSFTYNPLKNLVVYLITDMGTSGTVNPIHGETNATRYGSRFAYAIDTTSTSPAAGEDILSTIRFVMK